MESSPFLNKHTVCWNILWTFFILCTLFSAFGHFFKVFWRLYRHSYGHFLILFRTFNSVQVLSFAIRVKVSKRHQGTLQISPCRTASDQFAIHTATDSAEKHPVSKLFFLKRFLLFQRFTWVRPPIIPCVQSFHCRFFLFITRFVCYNAYT